VGVQPIFAEYFYRCLRFFWSAQNVICLANITESRAIEKYCVNRKPDEGRYEEVFTQLHTVVLPPVIVTVVVPQVKPPYGQSPMYGCG
jgi:hypothetical protein